jgi:hypothetical protein
MPGAMKVTAFGHVMPCGFVCRYQCFTVPTTFIFRYKLQAAVLSCQLPRSIMFSHISAADLIGLYHIHLLLMMPVTGMSYLYLGIALKRLDEK